MELRLQAQSLQLIVAGLLGTTLQLTSVYSQLKQPSLIGYGRRLKTLINRWVTFYDMGWWVFCSSFKQEKGDCRRLNLYRWSRELADIIYNIAAAAGNVVSSQSNAVTDWWVGGRTLVWHVYMLTLICFWNNTIGLMVRCVHWERRRYVCTSTCIALFCNTPFNYPQCTISSSMLSGFNINAFGKNCSFKFCMEH